MSRNALYVIIGVLVIALALLAWKYYDDQNSSKLEINMGNGGISVEAK
jgi:predicted negative regulator of RcsB-dependent stress response